MIAKIGAIYFMENALIIATGYEPEYLRIIEELINKCKNDGLVPVIFDLGPIMISPADSYSKRILNLFGLKAPSQLFSEKLASRGIQIISAKPTTNQIQELDTLQKIALKESVNSALLTYFRTAEINLSIPRVRKVSSALDKEGAQAFFSTQDLLSKMNFTVCYLPNGRFPIQRMTKLAIENESIKIFHFEKGATTDHAYLRPYSPHERLKSQQDVAQVNKDLSNLEIQQIASKWLDSRLPSKNSTNEYSLNWKTEKNLPSEQGIRPKRIGFFTSSQDEFLNLGPEWQLHSWKSQEEAFHLLLEHFESSGYTCYLRIHPNLASKNHSNFRQEVKIFKQLQRLHPNCIFYWHDDITNSYTLLEQSSGIVVWDSTIGLEASARGVPVWNCAAAYYGLIADTRDVFGPEDITANVLTPWKVDKEKAQKFISYSVKRDIPLTTDIETWTSWDTRKPPFIVKLAAISRSGGAPTIIDAFFAVIDPWRHRRISVNFAIIRSKIMKKRRMSVEN